MFKLNPITAKRIARFKGMRRAYVSLWVLGILYAVSLGSELVCNDKPLLVCYRQKLYFPVFKYYGEKEFIDGGEGTPVNYRELEKSSEFRGNGGRLVWPPLAVGPYEHVSVEELKPWLRCQVRLAVRPRIAKAVLLAETWEVADLAGGDCFLAQGMSWQERRFGDLWEVPEMLRQALEARFRNTACEAFEVICKGRDGNASVLASLTKYEPRKRAPKKVNVILNELRVNGGGKGDGLQMWLFKQGAETPIAEAAAFGKLPEDLQQKILEKVQTVFSGRETPTEEVQLEGSTCDLSLEMEVVRFPFRPIPRHWLGLDDSGRDVLARILYGLRTSLSFGLILVVCSMTFGILIGSVQGYLGGWVDITGQRLIEIWSALPFLYIVVLLGAVYGPSFWLLIVCYALFNWISMSYYMRAEMLRLRRLPFVEAARCLGLPGWKIVLKHILPNALVPVVTFFPFSLVGAVGALAALDYLGFGLPPPTASLGQLLQQAQSQRWAWWLILYPSLALFIVMLLGVFIGEGVREAFDPKRQSRLE